MPTGKPKFGLHIHLDKDINRSYQFIEAFQPPSVTIIDDIPLFRWCVEHKYVRWPVFRQVWGPWDPQPFHVGDESDIARGYKFFFEGHTQDMNLWWWNKQCPPGSILQIQNETNSWKMAWWIIGACQAARHAGYRLAYGNISVGQFANAEVNGQLVRPLYFDEQGNPRGDIVPGTNQTIWEHFLPCIKYSAAIQDPDQCDIFGVHVYGNEEDGQHRWPDDFGAPYYRDRIVNFMKMTPKPWPFIIYTEYGSGKTERQKDTGFEATWTGIKNFTKFIKPYPNILCGNVWTQGDQWGHLGFGGASLDYAIPEMIKRKAELQ